jgi:hypothetical protein
MYGLSMPCLDPEQLLALRLIGNGWNTKLTPFGNAIVSAQVQSLQRAGLIVQEPRRWMGYRLTAAGRTIATSKD